MNHRVLEELIRAYKDDAEILEAIQDALLSFEEYHRAIYTMETKRKLLLGSMDAMEFQETVAAMDRTRTSCHNAVLANVSMLNHMAAAINLPPVYDGTISEQQPYRRQVADAVLSYIHDIILERP